MHQERDRHLETPIAPGEFGFRAKSPRREASLVGTFVGDSSWIAANRTELRKWGSVRIGDNPPRTEHSASIGRILASAVGKMNLPCFLAREVEDLKFEVGPLQGRKACLTPRANGHNSSRNDHVHMRRGLFRRSVQLFGLDLAPLSTHLGDGVRGHALVGILCLPQLFNLSQLFLAQRKQIALKSRFRHCRSLGAFRMLLTNSQYTG